MIIWYRSHLLRELNETPLSQVFWSVSFPVKVLGLGLPPHDTSAWLYDLRRCESTSSFRWKPTRKIHPGDEIFNVPNKKGNWWHEFFHFYGYGSGSPGIFNSMASSKKTYVTWFGLHPPIFATNNQGQLVTAKSIENPPMTSQRMPPGCWWSSSNTTEVNLCDGLGTKRICFFLLRIARYTFHVCSKYPFGVSIISSQTTSQRNSGVIGFSANYSNS